MRDIHMAVEMDPMNPEKPEISMDDLEMDMDEGDEEWQQLPKELEGWQKEREKRMAECIDRYFEREPQLQKREVLKEVRKEYKLLNELLQTD